MKKIILVFVCILSLKSFAQVPYQVQNDGSNKILVGIITRDLIAKDSAFTWYEANSKNYIPNADAVKALQNNKEKVQFIVFGGTWCGDTKYLLPKFYVWLDAAGFSESRVSLYGVGHNKKTLGNLADALNIINVPTFILLKDGKEIARVVEYGKYGDPVKELGEVLQQIK